MKKYKYLPGLIVASLFVFGGCVNKKEDKHSKLVSFTYQGYGDTICALLFGQVAELDSSGRGNPLPGVRVFSKENGKETTTDSTGSFVLGFEEGVFSVDLVKEGYQSITLKNYLSDHDQVSVCSVYLVKGAGSQTAEIPKKK